MEPQIDPPKQDSFRLSAQNSIESLSKGPKPMAKTQRIKTKKKPLKARLNEAIKEKLDPYNVPLNQPEVVQMQGAMKHLQSFYQNKINQTTREAGIQDHLKMYIQEEESEQSSST